MVAMNDGHDHGDGEACAGCRFRMELAEHLDWAANQGDHDWHGIVGELTALMADSLAALSRLRSQRLDDGEADSQLPNEAAAAISRLGGAIDELWHALVDDEEDDPSVGL